MIQILRTIYYPLTEKPGILWLFLKDPQFLVQRIFLENPIWNVYDTRECIIDWLISIVLNLDSTGILKKSISWQQNFMWILQ
jgi:hypothetical protein